jgi:hypothetical protein
MNGRCVFAVTGAPRSSSSSSAWHSQHYLPPMLHQLARSLLHGTAVLEVASEAEEAVRVALHVVTRDLRDAGSASMVSSATGSATRDRMASTPARIAMVTAIPTIQRTHRLTPPTPPRAPTGARWLGVSRSRFSPNLTADGVSFRYYDAAGTLLSIDSTRCAGPHAHTPHRVTLQIELPTRIRQRRSPFASHRAARSPCATSRAACADAITATPSSASSSCWLR